MNKALLANASEPSAEHIILRRREYYLLVDLDCNILKTILSGDRPDGLKIFLFLMFYIFIR